MSHLFRLIYHSIIDFFFRKAEDSRNCCDRVLKYSPYLLGYRKLYSLAEYLLFYDDFSDFDALMLDRFSTSLPAKVP